MTCEASPSAHPDPFAPALAARMLPVRNRKKSVVGRPVSGSISEIWTSFGTKFETSVLSFGKFSGGWFGTYVPLPEAHFFNFSSQPANPPVLQPLLSRTKVNQRNIPGTCRVWVKEERAQGREKGRMRARACLLSVLLFLGFGTFCTRDLS